MGTITYDVALRCGLRFVRHEGRVPTATDLRVSTMPSAPTIAKLFGSLKASQALLAPAVPRRPPRTLTRVCLLCDAPFRPGHAGLFVCPPCKTTEAWQATTDWMGGTLNPRGPKSSS